MKLTEFTYNHIGGHLKLFSGDSYQGHFHGNDFVKECLAKNGNFW